MGKLISILAHIWCKLRIIWIYNFVSDVHNKKGWYGVDVMDMKKHYPQFTYDKFFYYRKEYTHDKYEMFRTIRIGNYRLVISYYKFDGWQQEHQKDLHSHIENVITLKDYQKEQTYTYNHLDLGQIKSDIQELKRGGKH